MKPEQERITKEWCQSIGAVAGSSAWKNVAMFITSPPVMFHDEQILVRFHDQLQTRKPAAGEP